MDFIKKIKKVTEAQKHVPLRFYLFNLMVNSCLSTLGNMPPSTTHKKQRTYRHTGIQIYSHTDRADENASEATLKRYLKSAD